MPYVTITHTGGADFSVQGAQLNETGNYVRVDKAGIKAEVNDEMSKIDSDEGYSVEVNGEIIVGLTYDEGTTSADSISFAK